MNNIICTFAGCIYIFGDKHTHIYMYATIIKENEAMHLNDSEGVESTYEMS